MTDDLKKLLAEATNRPWKANTADKTGEDWLIASLGNSNEDGLDYIVTTDRVRASELDGDAKADAALIVAAVNALPELVERVKRLEARIAQLETPTMQWNPDDPEVPIESVEALAEHFADYGHPCGVFEVQNAHELPYTYHFYNVMVDSQELDDDDPIETHEVVCREITKEEYRAGLAAAAIGWFAKRAKWATDRAAIRAMGGE